MVAARQRLLSAGHLDAVTQAVLAAVPRTASGVVLDAGGGTGHHLARLLDASPGLTGVVVDVAKPALRRAARAHPRMVAVRADVWRELPVAPGSVSWILDVFAPRSGAEFHRILTADGRLVVVTPNQDHLCELVTALGLLTVDPAKYDRLAAGLDSWFELAERSQHTTTRSISRADAEALVGMGPSAWHTDRARIVDQLAALAQPMRVTVSISLTVWRPRVSKRASTAPTDDQVSAS
jgi:23S rRNA (guanine745-N1)-methyltransferase